MQANIITIVDQRNYGNRLQNCALSLVLERMGLHPVGTLRFRNGRFSDARSAVKMALGALRHGRMQRLRSFGAFSRKHVPYHWIDPVKLAQNEGVFVIGSDQVWNPFFSMGGRPDGAQYAAGAAPCRKIAYAPSFGVSLEDIPLKARSSIANGLDQIAHLSVREASGQEIIRSLTGRDAPVVLDPTMLIPCEEWAQLEHPPALEAIREPFCLKYVLGEDVAANEIDGLARDRGIGVVDLTIPHLPVGPAEFLYLVHHAEFVCTDSFHAAVFSLLFHTPFLVFERHSSHRDMSSRFQTLDALFPLRDWRCGPARGHDGGITEQDWSAVDESLDSARSFSVGFLDGALRSAAADIRS